MDVEDSEAGMKCQVKEQEGSRVGPKESQGLVMWHPGMPVIAQLGPLGSACQLPMTTGSQPHPANPQQPG